MPVPSIRRRQVRGRLPRVALAVAAAAVLAAGAVACEPVVAPPPEFRSGQGITVEGAALLAGSDRTYVVDISTPSIHPGAVNGAHQVRITLPTEYRQHPGWRFPVLYLLHGGAGGSSRQWTTEGGAVEAITAPHRLITVMPDGGKVGWFTDWVETSAGAQAWEEFHLEQLVPWIDANLRTADHRLSRGVAGLSMGGFGAIHYAQQRPDLFSYAASFSGALDLADAGVRTVIAQQATSNGFPASGPFGTAGTPASTWESSNPVGRAADLEDVWVSLYAGSGTWDLDILERTVGATTDRMSTALTTAGIDHHWWMYGRTPQPTVPYRCDGGHNFGCWNFALDHSMPAMMDRLLGP